MKNIYDHSINDSSYYTDREYAIVETIKINSKKNFLVNSLICICGILLTYIGESSASAGGNYTVFIGAIVFGGYRALLSLLDYIYPRHSKAYKDIFPS